MGYVLASMTRSGVGGYLQLLPSAMECNAQYHR